MTFRISQFRAVCSFSLLILPVAALAQAPRYQSPLAVPNEPQQQITLPTPAAITPDGVVVEDVIARVNDRIISRSDMERSIQQLAAENQQNRVPEAEAEDRQKNLLRDMVDQQLLLSRAKELGLNADAEVIRRLDEIRKQNHMDSMEALEKAAAQQGVSFEDFKANIRNGILTQQVVRDEVGRHIQMTQGTEQAYYEAHKNEFAQPEQVHLSEILIPTPADASDAVVAQAQAKADSIAEKIKGGADFAEMAKQNSGGPTASQGGDLGLFKRGALAKVLEDQTFSLPTGGVTAPIRTRQGFVILKVTDHQQAGVPALKDIEPQIQEAIYMKQIQPALRAYLTKLREDAYIDIKPGFVDTGASPNQTKPVFSAYAPPAPKKKKAEKQRFDRGGRFSTVSKEKTAAPATGAAATASAAAPAVSATPSAAPKQQAALNASKPKKIKREKVRFGQAPRNALPPGQQETAEGEGAGMASSPQAADSGAAVAPGTAIAPLENSAQLSNEDPLAPKPEHENKTRYAYRSRTEAQEKAAKKQAVVKQKAAFTPAPASNQETEDRKEQSAPLGLNGDTATKKKKIRQKGAPKERLQNQPTAPAPPPPPPAPTVNPDLGATPEGLTPTPPPAPQPAQPQN
ncbi:peptidylprolyl isomerase [Edaphobacter sp. 12200R-103]|uniref:peptidylprolyl isomerase n=1 Tax=Edaphobacter sp. 12200R-103 TaxID=2703788 RepID=UPI00138D2B3F|nr:peptidylprolyl isomerase [Edaphobacter sp. 12200R-103]QHS50465.1 peptidylprolyl isomerase [Edaphobacter sp. 12200R-103]